MVEYSLKGVECPEDDYKHTWEVLEVLDEDSGPCSNCDLPTVRLLARQHTSHKGYDYHMTFDWIYAHADGSPSHDDNETMKPKKRCLGCLAYGTTTIRQLAYGDLTECSQCDYSYYYSIGD